MIVCSKEGADKSQIVSRLLPYRKSIVLKHKDKMYQNYLRHNFINEVYDQAIYQRASTVDHEK